MLTLVLVREFCHSESVHSILSLDSSLEVGHRPWPRYRPVDEFALEKLTKSVLTLEELECAYLIEIPHWRDTTPGVDLIIRHDGKPLM